MQVINSVFLRNTAQNGAGIFVQKCAYPSLPLMTRVLLWALLPESTAWQEGHSHHVVAKRHATGYGKAILAQGHACILQS